MSQLMSTLTTENMSRYNKIYHTFPDYKTPSISSMSTPEQTTGQRATSNQRLNMLCSVPPVKRLQFLNKEIAKEVEQAQVAKAQTPVQPKEATPTKGDDI